MTDFARRKAEGTGISAMRFVTSAAEDPSLPEDAFDLAAIGNAFHRVRREVVAGRALRRLRPGGFVARRPA